MREASRWPAARDGPPRQAHGRWHTPSRVWTREADCRGAPAGARVEPGVARMRPRAGLPARDAVPLRAPAGGGYGRLPTGGRVALRTLGCAFFFENTFGISGRVLASNNSAARCGLLAAWVFPCLRGKEKCLHRGNPKVLAARLFLLDFSRSYSARAEQCLLERSSRC